MYFSNTNTLENLKFLNILLDYTLDLNSLLVFSITSITYSGVQNDRNDNFIFLIINIVILIRYNL